MARLWIACPCEAPQRPTRDEVCLRKRRGKAAGIYSACEEAVKCWWLSLSSISNFAQPPGKQFGYPPYRRLQRNVQQKCRNLQQWISTAHVGRLCNGTTSQAPPGCTNSLGFCKPVCTEVTGMGRAVSWEPGTAGAQPRHCLWVCHLVASHGAFCLPSPVTRRKHWEIFEFWCGFAFIQVPRCLQRADTKVSTSSSSHSYPTLSALHLSPFFPLWLPQKVGRMSWIHKSCMADTDGLALLGLKGRWFPGSEWNGSSRWSQWLILNSWRTFQGATFSPGNAEFAVWEVQIWLLKCWVLVKWADRKLRRERSWASPQSMIAGAVNFLRIII